MLARGEGVCRAQFDACSSRIFKIKIQAKSCKQAAERVEHLGLDMDVHLILECNVLVAVQTLDGALQFNIQMKKKIFVSVCTHIWVPLSIGATAQESRRQCFRERYRSARASADD
eukprot:4117450-Pleurochrysis_carterae.AAC.1